VRILLETNQRDQENRKSYHFEDPDLMIRCHRLYEVENTFQRMEKALADGYYLAGFLSYEAGYAFEACFRNNNVYDFPLLCFGAYKNPGPLPNPPTVRPKTISPKINLATDEYFESLAKIKKLLLQGETYQVNYTFKQKFKYQGNPYALYRKLKSHQLTPYSAFIEARDFSIFSYSPELFFRKKGDKIKVKPMKGTIEPGGKNALQLMNDPKNRSENLMIVDLLRSDLGRIARTGTVKTTKLFEVEKHETIYHMTSTVEAKIPRNLGLYDLFSNIFPSGSVTGAPKIRTMQIIRELEKEERKIYTGCIGFITPQKDMVFNVAIRTLLLEGARGEMGIGSGIVFDSNPCKELEECLLKSKFLFAD
jgi:para-aminobenzoate synthetase/4-amino-4-deoxychorismate lyase